jgi:PHD/YefM family antitoxin component YafN of YafNO toxin-antitoxin module
MLFIEVMHMTRQYTPTNARKNLFGIINDVTSNNTVVEIVPASGKGGVAVVSLADWAAIEETLFLEQTGVLNKVRQREMDDSGFTNVDDLDWDKL